MLTPNPILHVEDSEDDRFFVKRAFEDAQILNSIHYVSDGKEAIEYFSGTGKFADRQAYPMPCLVLLDLNMPNLHGMEVLKWIRQNKDLKSLVVIILSSSPLRDDVDTAYELGVNSFIVKPLTLDGMSNLARLIKAYWLETNELPSVSGMKEPIDKIGIKPRRRWLNP